jgi:hypothetical protein
MMKGWDEFSPLKEVFKELFSFACLKDTSVAEHLQPFSDSQRLEH